MANVIEKTGKTVEEAISEALAAIGAKESEVDVEVLETPSKKLFGLLGTKPAKVRVSLKVPKPARTPAMPEKSPDEISKSDSLKNSAAEKFAEVKAVAAEKAQEFSDEVKTAAAEKIEEVKSSAAEKVEEVKTSAAEKVDEIKTSAAEKIDEVKTSIEEKVSEVKENAEEKISEIRDSAEEKISGIAAEVKDAEEEIAEVEEFFDKEETVKRAENFLQNVFAAMKIEVEVKTKETDDGYIADLIGKNLGLLIGKHGQTLDALQYLTNLAANKADAPGRVHFTLDVENYRARRAETLTKLAKSCAEKAVRERREIRLEAMNRHERKVIHTALQDNHRVETHSAGEEPYRYIVISPKKNNRH